MMKAISISPTQVLTLAMLTLMSALFFIYWNSEKNKNEADYKYEKGPFWFGCAITMWIGIALIEVFEDYVPPSFTNITPPLLSIINNLFFIYAYKYLVFAPERRKFKLSGNEFTVHFKNTNFYSKVAGLLVIFTLIFEIAEWDDLILLPALGFSFYTVVMLMIGFYSTFKGREQPSIAYFSVAILLGILAYQFNRFLPEETRNNLQDWIFVASLTLKSTFIGILLILIASYVNDNTKKLPIDLLKVDFVPGDRANLFKFVIGMGNRQPVIVPTTRSRYLAILELAVERKRSKEPQGGFLENSLIGNANTLNRAIEDIVVAAISSSTGMDPRVIRAKVDQSNIDSDDGRPAFDNEFYRRVYRRKRAQVKLNLFDEMANETRMRIAPQQISIAPQIVQKISSLSPRKGESVRLKKLIEKLIVCGLAQNMSDEKDTRLLQSGI